MKSSKKLLHLVKSNEEEIPKKAGVNNLLKYMLILFILSLITFMSSCAVWVRTPRHERHGVIIEGTDNRGHHDHSDHHDRNDRHD